MFKHILLPTDGSELSQRAARSGIEFAKSAGARVTAFHVCREYTPMLATEGFGYIDPASMEVFEQNAKAFARSALSFIEQAAVESGVACDSCFETSFHVFDAIIRTAADKGCDLIWMASHGRGGLAGLLLGSETTKVLAHSKIPVLVYR